MAISKVQSVKTVFKSSSIPAHHDKESLRTNLTTAVTRCGLDEGLVDSLMHHFETSGTKTALARGIQLSERVSEEIGHIYWTGSSGILIVPKKGGETIRVTKEDREVNEKLKPDTEVAAFLKELALADPKSTKVGPYIPR